jgi:hypothetical protein
MAKVIKKRSSVAKDTVLQPENTFGMPVKKGRVVKQQKGFYVTVGQRKVQIPVGILVSQKDIAKMVGKDVRVVFSKQQSSEIVAIGLWPVAEKMVIKKPWIICYIPALKTISSIDPAIRDTLITKMVQWNIITPELESEFRSSSETR